MEYWSVGEKENHHLVDIPILQYSNTPELMGIDNWDDGLPITGL
jgi:hypothetical protein